MKHIIYILLFLISFNGVAQFSDEQQHQIDSLNEVIMNSNSPDTSVAAAYVALTEFLYLLNLDTVLSLNNKALKLARMELKNEPNSKETSSLLYTISLALNNIGFVYHSHGQMDKALLYYEKSLVLKYKFGDKQEIANSLMNVGGVYENQGAIEKALEAYHEGLKNMEVLGNEEGIANFLNYLGHLYSFQGDTKNGLLYAEKALEIQNRIGDKVGAGYTLQLTGFLHHKVGDLSAEMKAYKESERLLKESGDLGGAAISLGNMASVCINKGDSQAALQYASEALEIQQEIGDKRGQSSSLFLLSKIYFLMGNNQLSITRAHESLKLSKAIGFPSRMMEVAKLLAQIYEAQGKGLKALEMYKLHVQMKDSINNETTQKATIRQQTQYEFEKTQIVKENEAKEQARLEAEETSRRNNLQYSLIFLGILVLFVGIMMLGFIKVSPNVAEGLIFFAFLILFEFVLVFLDPYLEQYTHGEPMYNLAANAGIALLIFPLHAILEKLLKKRIVKS